MLFLNAGFAVVLATDSIGFLKDIPQISVVSISVMTVSALLFFIGESPLFPWLCSKPVIWRLFPNIDGNYDVEISSNWSVINSRNECSKANNSANNDVKLFKKTGKAKITSRLTRITMRLDMDDKYLTSETVVCSLQRKQGENFPTLYYVYESHVTTPKSTDSQRHLGTGRISIPLEPRPVLLEGNYWTDRNWHLGLNTAGRIKLRRI